MFQVPQCELPIGKQEHPGFCLSRFGFMVNSHRKNKRDTKHGTKKANLGPKINKYIKITL